MSLCKWDVYTKVLVIKAYNETDFHEINLFIENNWIVDKQINTTTTKKSHVCLYLNTYGK